MNKLTLDILNAHAPLSATPLCELAAWWDDLQCMVSRRADAIVPLVCMIDANARLGTIASTAVGLHCAEEEGDAGDQFHRFLLRNRLYLPATFEDCAKEGRSTTWVSPEGTSTRRIDYVAIPVAWPMLGVSACIWEDLDLLAKRDDHFMAVVCVEVAGQIIAPSRRWRASVCNTRLMRDSSKCEAFAAELKEVPAVQWQIDAQSHWADATHKVRDLLAKHFPMQDRGPKKEWISEKTWSLMSTRRAYRRVVQQCTRDIIIERVASVFVAWRSYIGIGEGGCLTLALLPPSHDVFFAYAHALHLLNVSLGFLKENLRADRQRYVNNIKDIAAKAAAGNDTRTLYACVRKLQRGKTQPPRGILLEDGSPASDPAQVRQRWQRHFAEAMAGEIRAQEELATTAAGKGAPVCSLDALMVPSLIEVEAIFAHAHRGRAAGVDAIPPEAYAAAPQAMAKIFHPLMVKAALRFEEPLSWKGGVCIELYKGKGPVLQCKSYRDVLVSDIVGKAYHKTLRNRLMPVLNRVGLDTQCGGLGSRGSDFGAHIVRQFLDYCRVSKTSGAVLFVDVVGAFASVVREIVLGGLTDAGHVAALCAKLRLSQTLGQDIVEIARSGGILGEAGASQHLLELIREAHRCTWFATEGVTDVVQTAAGTRAGDPLADAIFNLLMSSVLSTIRMRLRSAGLMFEVPWPTCMPATSATICREDGTYFMEGLDVSYVDDVALMIQAAQAADLAAKVSRATAVVIDAFAEHGLVVNMQPGKTEAIMCWRGRGSRGARQKVVVEHGAIVPVVQANGTERSLRVVESYKHLGGQAAADASMRPELCNRIRSAKAVYGGLQRPLFADKGIPLRTRSHLAESLVDSRIFCNAATWPGMQEVYIHKMEVSRARPYRTMLGLELRPETALVPCRQVIQCARAMPTDRCISLARLRYLPRFQRSAPPLLYALAWATAADEDSWMKALEEDLRWLQGLMVAKCKEIRPLDDVVSWMKFADASRRRWKTLLKNAVAEDTQLRESELYADQSAVTVHDQTFICGECAMEFGSKAALNTHFGSKHLINVARLYAEGSVCRGCLMSFTSRDHVVHHLAVSKRRCLDLLMVRCRPLSEAQLAALDSADRLRRRGARAAGVKPSQASWPAHRVPGPLRRQLPVPVTPPGTPPSDSSAESLLV